MSPRHITDTWERRRAVRMVDQMERLGFTKATALDVVGITHGQYYYWRKRFLRTPSPEAIRRNAGGAA